MGKEEEVRLLLSRVTWGKQDCHKSCASLSGLWAKPQKQCFVRFESTVSNEVSLSARLKRADLAWLSVNCLQTVWRLGRTPCVLRWPAHRVLSCQHTGCLPAHRVLCYQRS